MRTGLLFLLLLAACRAAPLGIPGESETTDATDGAVGNAPDLAPACSTYTELTQCLDDPACSAFTCGACEGRSGFACFPVGDGSGIPLSCPRIECPVVCSGHDTESSCAADSRCVAVFEELVDADCATFPCMVFTRCDRGPATCRPSGLPACATPTTCAVDYVPLFEGQCASGCVRSSACAIPG